MSVVAAGLGAALGTAAATALAALVAPRPARAALSGGGTAVCGAAAVVAGVAAIRGAGDGAVGSLGRGWGLVAPDLLPLSGTRLLVDPLSGVFIGVVGAVAVSAGVYAVGYPRRGLVSSRTASMMLPLFVASMLVVPAAAGIGAFLACWELMALTSLLLVLAEHRRGAPVASAGRWYAVMTHLGFVAILLGLAALGSVTGDGFAEIRERAGDVPTPLAGLVFVLLLVGFGSKAGAVPLHAWLPRAHPEAPSHVSTLMSAAMVTMGVYGIVRFGLDLLHGGARWWWLLVLVVGGLSAIYGILQAAMSSDLKRLLGFSTTENMGLVLVGVGAAGLFATAGDGVLAGLAMTAALLHVVNHAAFKTVLFEAAGSVLHAAGTRDLDELGGLRARMPATTVLFGVGAFAASALPLGPAFVSEWLLLQALVHGLGAGGVATAIVMPVAVAAVAVTAGLAVATFVKAFGVGFLARPRSVAAAGAHDGPTSMSVGMGLAAVGCVALGVAPTLVVPAMGGVSAALFGSTAPVSAEPLLVALTGFTGAVSPPLVALALLGGGLAAAAVVRMLAARPARARARLWDCGAGPLSSRMEYTSTSFAEPLQRVFDNVVRPEHDVEVTHHRESRYLVEAVNYRLRVPDRVEHRLYAPVLRGARLWARAGAWLATGSVHRYLGYGFVSLCLLLVVLVASR